MKNLFITTLTVLITSLSLSSCTSYDDSNDVLFGDGTSTSSSDIVGEWKLTSLKVQTPVDLNGDGTFGTDLMIEGDCYKNEFLKFNKDNTGENISNSYLEIEITGNFPTDPTAINSECIEEAESESFAWVKSGEKNYNLTIGGQLAPATLNGTILTVTIPKGQIYMDDEFNIVLEEDMTMIYTKQ